MLFADDSTLSCKIDQNNIIHSTNKINSELEKVCTWLNANQIKLNIEKSTFLVFSYMKSINLPPILINQCILAESNHTKFLGLTIDNRLNFAPHIFHIKSKLAKSVGILYRLRYMLPTCTLLTLYHSLILPHMNYVIEAWQSAPNYLKQEVFILQKKAIRAIYHLPYNSHTHESFKDSGLLKLDDLIKIRLCTQIYEAIHSNDHSLSSFIKTHQENTARNTRNMKKLMLPFFRKSRSQAGFLYSGIKEWNELPESVKNSRSQNAFKSRIKKYFLSLY